MIGNWLERALGGGAAGPRIGSVPVLGPHGFFRMSYRDWGRRDNPRVLICVHGLTRNARDFDRVARRLARGWRVVCPDMPGRGESDYLPVKGDYGYPLYATACATLIAHLGADRVDWLGTSMGGIIGMQMAAQPNSPIARMILNDIGPFISKAAIDRIIRTAGDYPVFDDLVAAQAWYRGYAATFGVRNEADFREFVDIGVRRTENGKLRRNFDQAVIEPLRATPPAEIAFWPVWDAIKCPVLVIRGGESDLLLAETADEMGRRGPKSEVVTIPGVGHAPALMDPGQIEIVASWFERPGA